MVRKTVDIFVLVLFTTIALGYIPAWGHGGEYSHEKVPLLQSGSGSNGSCGADPSSSQLSSATQKERIQSLDCSIMSAVQLSFVRPPVPYNERQDGLFAWETREEKGRGASYSVSEAGNRSSMKPGGPQGPNAAYGQRSGSQRQWHGGGGWNGGWGHRNDDFAGGILGGFLGGVVGTIFAPRPEPEVVIVPAPEVPELQPFTPAWYSYCTEKFKSFEPQSGTYTGFDGERHFCR